MACNIDLSNISNQLEDQIDYIPSGQMFLSNNVTENFNKYTNIYILVGNMDIFIPEIFHADSG